MRILLLLSFLHFSQAGFTQEITQRYEGENYRHFVERFFHASDSLAHANDSSAYVELVHPIVEVNFGTGVGKIVTCFTLNGGRAIYTGLFVPVGKDQYAFSYLGGNYFGAHPDYDSILSVFTYDHNGDGTKELMVLCQGGERVVDKDSGLSGCCGYFYFTKVFQCNDQDVLTEVEDYAYTGLKTAAAVKAAINKKYTGQHKTVSKEKKSK